MDTTHGEPEWVNWSKERHDMEEARDGAYNVGACINFDLCRLYESLPSEEGWHKHYDLLTELETFHHDVLALITQAQFLGLIKTR
jgi:hypothetical protein